MSIDKSPGPVGPDRGQPAHRLARRATHPISLTADNGKRHAVEEETALPVTIGLILRSIGQWWKVALPMGLLLALAAGAVVMYQFVPVYRATAWIQIDEQAPYIAYPNQDESRRFVQTQVELMQSPLVLAPVVARDDVADLPEIRNNQEPIKWLAEGLQVVSRNRSDLFDVSLPSRRPDDAAMLVNAILDSYFQLRTERNNESTQRVIALLEEEKQRRAKDVQRLREKVRTLSLDIHGRDPFTGTPTVDMVMMNHPLQALQERLTDAEVQRNLLEVELQALQEEMASSRVEIPESYVEMAAVESPDLQIINERLQYMRTLLPATAERAKYGKEDPNYLRLAREVEALEDSRRRAIAEIAPRIREEMTLVAEQQRHSEVSQLESALDRQEKLERMLRAQYEEHLKESGGAKGRSLDLEFARAELVREERVFEMIAERALALRTEMRAPDRVRLMKRAAPPRSPVEQFPVKPLSVAMLLSLCAPFGAAVLWERVTRRIGSSRDLAKEADMRVLGEVSELPTGRRALQATGNGKRDLRTSLFEESIDSLRTCLLLGSDNDTVKVVAVASAVPREGKTSVASQLAVSLARASGGRSLLIDADMRSPDVHRIFGIANEPGLSKVLDGSCTSDEAIVTTWSDAVHLLPAGMLHKNPHNLLGTHAFEHLLEKLRLQYDHIVVDIPPVLSASESLVLAQAADGTLLCALRDRSRGSQVRLAVERLVASGARPVGATLNGVPAKRYAYAYGTYSYVYQES